MLKGAIDKEKKEKEEKIQTIDNEILNCEENLRIKKSTIQLNQTNVNFIYFLKYFIF